MSSRPVLSAAFPWALSLLLAATGTANADKTLATIVAFGDSTTAPRGSLTVYPTLLRKQLFQQFDSIEVINAGVGGDTTGTARARFKKDVLHHKPDVVIIQFGINDSTVDVWKNPPATAPRLALANYEGNLRYFIKAIRTAGAQPILMTPNPLHWTPKLKELYGKPPYQPGDEDGFNVMLSRYTEKVRAIAKEETVPLVDVYRAMKPRAQELLLDGMHPNDQGQRLVAEKLLPLVRHALAK